MFTRALSHSSMGLYRECPQRFKFRYIDGIKEGPRHYFSFGQSVHTAMEFFYSSQLLPPTLDEIIAHYKMNWVKEGYKSPLQEKEYFEDGVKIITGFYNKHLHDWKAPLSTEYDFSLILDGISLRGKIDRIDKLPNGNLHVIDYKTGKTFASGKVTQDEQLTLYQVACESAFNAPVEKLTLYHLPTLTPMDSERHSDILTRQLRRNILSVKTAIDNEQFDPNPEDWKCSRCDYKKICPAWSADPKAAAKTSFRASPVKAAEAPAARPMVMEIPGLNVPKAVSGKAKEKITSQIDRITEKVEDLNSALRDLKNSINEL